MDTNKDVKLSKDAMNFFDDVPKVNFYVIDKNRNYIYKNKTLCKIVGDLDKVEAPETWEWSQKVMETGKEITVEEEHNGIFYLSTKTPLIIDGKVEGIIGVSIDITDLKRKGQLKIQKELGELETQEDVMNTSNLCVTWSKDTRKFLDDALDNSLNLIFVASHGSRSQTGVGFQEFVNTINSEALKRKIKKLTIIDASYLYRHSIPAFHQLASSETPSIWFLNNEDTIKQIQVDTEIISWATLIDSSEYDIWYGKVMLDFQTIESFKNAIIEEANYYALNGKGTYNECLEFLLEERSVTCAFLKDATHIYPVPMSNSLLGLCERHNLSMRRLTYKISKRSQNIQKQIKEKKHDFLKIQQEILTLLPAVPGTTFFALDKEGYHIYRNKELSQIIGNSTSRVVSPEAWATSKEVMKLKKQIVVEEEYLGNYFLSVKSPLIVDRKLEGVIGIAIDITDRKKAEYLEVQNKLQKRIEIISEQVAHDIRSPLVVLSMLSKNCKNLSEKEHIALRNSITTIESIAQNLLNGYSMKNEGSDGLTEEAYVLFPFCISEVLNDKRYQYRDLKNVRFDYSYTMASSFVFIKGNYSDFCRMISNLLNNAVEAFKNKSGIIEIKFVEEDEENKILIKDNGAGMPKEVVTKLMENEQVASTKEDGHGIGMRQIRDTILKMKGHMSIDSTENVGTEITLTFPKSGYPEWFTDKIVLHKGDTVVVLDDDPSIHSVWENRLKKYSGDTTVKYFTQGSETISFINSSKDHDKIFLLTDYELRNQEINGVDVIEKCNMQKRSIVVTSVYIYQIKDFLEKFKVNKLLPKAYIDRISIAIEERPKNVDLVIIDNDASFLEALSTFKKDELLMDTYTSPKDFLNNLNKYSKDTKIITDYELTDGMNGLVLANQLYEQGYVNLYLFSGRPFREGEVPSYLTVIFKGDSDFTEKLL